MVRDQEDWIVFLCAGITVLLHNLAVNVKEYIQVILDPFHLLRCTSA